MMGRLKQHIDVETAEADRAVKNVDVHLDTKCHMVAVLPSGYDHLR
jgi:hypothetical protein